jgi:hypothetical protein
MLIFRDIKNYRPDAAARQDLARKAADLCEKARTSIRAARHQGQKQLKHDIDTKVVGDSEGQREAKEVNTSSLLPPPSPSLDSFFWTVQLDELTRKKTAEVDNILKDAKRVILDQ